MFIYCYREELRGIKRGKEDIDWSKVANTIVAETITKPSPIKISVSEVLAKVKPSKIQASTAIQTDVVDMNGKYFKPKNNVNDYNIFFFFLLISVRAPQVMCYMTSWSIKRPGAGKFTPDNIDPSLCTHVLYAFGSLKDFKLTFVDEKDTEQYKAMMGLREKNANLKVQIFIEI